MSAKTPPHQVVNRIDQADSGHRASRRRSRARVSASTQGVVSSSPANQQTDAVPEQELLKLHASDLIGRIQNWADDLKMRESKLKVALASIDQREQALKIRQKDVQRKLDQQKAELGDIRDQLITQARELVFRTHG